MSILETLIQESQYNCWSQADAVFHVCLARANERQVKSGCGAAMKLLQTANRSCTMVQLSSPTANALSVHAFLLVKENDIVHICQAMQSDELAMHKTASATTAEIINILQHLKCSRFIWKDKREWIESLCRMTLDACFADEDAMTLRMFTIEF